MNTIDVAVICKALGDSNRLQIVQMLSDGEKCGCAKCNQLEEATVKALDELGMDITIDHVRDYEKMTHNTKALSIRCI